MQIQLLQSIAGTGDFVEGSRREFALDAGMLAEVREDMALRWIASGIARAVTPAPETAALPAPETAVRKRKKGTR